MKNALPLAGCCKEVDPDSVKTFYINGTPPMAGTIFRNPDLAKTFRLIQAAGARRVLQGRNGARDRREVEGARRYDDARGSRELQGRVGHAGVDDLSRSIHGLWARGRRRRRGASSKR